MKTAIKKPYKLRALLKTVLVLAILSLVFLSYLQPAFILDLANRYILC
ncbi:MAG: hypothetical protein K2P84_06025 [Undibacterium sp.]|nr:hypothetical protein [Undibacterium sp.]